MTNASGAPTPKIDAETCNDPLLLLLLLFLLLVLRFDRFFPIENRVLAAGNDEASDCAAEQRREEKEVEVTGACMVDARSIFVSMFCSCDSACAMWKVWIKSLSPLFKDFVL